LRKTASAKYLSEQYLISCNSNGWSCNGGWFAHDYHLKKYITGETAAGAVYESTFPYRAANVACNPPHQHQEKLSSWSYVNLSNPYSVPSVAAIKQAIYKYGPISAAVCVGSQFQRYKSGIFSTNESCGSSAVNHAIVLAGWDDTTQSWLLRNSWGSSWGESGYMRIKYNTSNIGYAANYVVSP
jgi:C1A family cysteine protease